MTSDRRRAMSNHPLRRATDWPLIEGAERPPEVIPDYERRGTGKPAPPPRRPSLGLGVIIKGFHANGKDEHPAVITHVHTDNLVNVMIFPDNGIPTAKTTLKLYETREQAEQGLRREPARLTQRVMAAFWPDRV